MPNIWHCDRLVVGQPETAGTPQLCAGREDPAPGTNGCRFANGITGRPWVLQHSPGSAGYGRDTGRLMGRSADTGARKSARTIDVSPWTGSVRSK